MQCAYNATLRRVGVTIIAVEKQKLLYILYVSECVSVCVCVALVIQHKKSMRCIIESFVACPALIIFSTLSHKQERFSEKK